MKSRYWTMEWSVVVLTILLCHTDAEYSAPIGLLTMEGNDVTLPFPHQRRCSRRIHICHFPLFENGSSQNGDCQSAACQAIVTCKDRSTFEPSDEFIDRLGVKEDENGQISDVIVNVTAMDAGIYHYCPSWEVRVKQQALVIIQNPPTAPEILSQSSPLRGKPYTITCDTKSRSLPVDSGLAMNFRWKRKGNELINNPEIAIAGPNLTIRNLTLESDGVDITCSVKEEEGQWTEECTPFLVSVEYGPETVDMAVIESDDDVIQITCSADCRPPCSLVFVKDNSTVKTEVGKTKNTIDPACGTHYTCIAHNIHRTARHTFELCAGTSAPTVSTLLANNVSTEYSLGENQTLQLSCVVIGRPKPMITWHVTQGDDQSLKLLKTASFRPAFISNVHSGIRHEYLSTHVIHNVQCNQSGRYLCKAESGRGKAEKHVDVTVKCGPKILKSNGSTAYIQLGKALNIDISVMSATAPLVACNRVDNAVSRTCRLNVTVTSYKARMNVASDKAKHNVYRIRLSKDNTDKDDAGLYVVMVTNEAGMIKEEFTLVFQDATTAPKESLGPVLSGSIVSVVCLVCVAMVIGIYVRKRLNKDKLEVAIVSQGNILYTSPKSPSRVRLIWKPEVSTA